MGSCKKWKISHSSKLLMQQARLLETYSKNNFQVRLAGAVEHNKCAEITDSARTLIPQLPFAHLLFLSSFFSFLPFLPSFLWQKCSSCKKAIMEQMLLELPFCRPRTGREAILKHVYTCHAFPLRYVSKLGKDIYSASDFCRIMQ